jgi:hypothetical protein
LNQLITLSSISELDIAKVGQRAINLSIAYKSKANVPLSFIVPNSVFYEFLLQNKLILEIRKITNFSEKTDESFENAYLQIKSLFESSVIPEEFKEELFEAYEALSSTETHNAQALLEGDEPVINLIISPSYSMKSEKLSGVLFNIQGFDNFLNGLKSCYLALYSPEHLKERELNGINEFTAGIIVQEFIQADCTIDAYSKSLLGDYDIPINAYFGLPDITYKISKDHYSVSKDNFGIAAEEIKHQEHILLRNIKSGTLLKRSLGTRGLVQKIPDKQILEIARNIDKLSVFSKSHFRIILFAAKSKSIIFLIDKISERTADLEDLPKKEIEIHEKNSSGTSQIGGNEEVKITPNTAKVQTLAELVNSPISHEDYTAEEDNIEQNKNKDKEENTKNIANKPQEIVTSNQAFAKETKILPNEPAQFKSSEKQMELSEKIIILNDNDEFILSPKEQSSIKEAISQVAPEVPKIKTEQNALSTEQIELKTAQAERTVKPADLVNPDNDFFMSIILDIEPALDQEILKRYQEKFEKVPADVTAALEELSAAGHLPENEQIFKLKSMKTILERGETINLEVFLEVTEELRKLI